jgi:hypothetical protein
MRVELEPFSKGFGIGVRCVGVVSGSIYIYIMTDIFNWSSNFVPFAVKR